MKTVLGPLQLKNRVSHEDIEKNIVSVLSLSEEDSKKFSAMVYGEGGHQASLKLSEDVQPELSEKIKSAFEAICSGPAPVPLPPIVPTPTPEVPVTP